MKTKTLHFIRAICLCLLLLLPLAALPVMAFATPPVFSETFVGELDEKYERLSSIEEPKIVIVGGSSVAFGFDSALIEETMGMPVVNFGLYADLGTKLMMDLSESCIKEGDIVILAPEIDTQTMSLYFNADMTLHAVEEDPSMLLRLPADELLQTVGSLFDFVGQKLSYIVDGTVSRGSAIYDARYFNEYGDVDGSADLNDDGYADFPRTINAMPSYYDPARPIQLSPDTISEEFLEYMQEYQAFCEKRGATFYYAFCPMNASALTYAADSEEAQAFVKCLSDALGKNTILGTPQRHIFAPNYFYDSNFHLNMAGVTAHTVTLLDSLLLAEGNVTATIPAVIPEPPELPKNLVIYEGEDDPACAYFTMEFATEFSAALGMEMQLGYRITGLTELGKAQKTLTIPVNYQGYRVTLIGEEALEGGICETLVLPKEFNQFAYNESSIVFTFEPDFLRSAGSQFKALHLYINECSNIMPPEGHGADAPFKIHTPVGSEYSNGYFWERIDKDDIVEDLIP